MESKCKGWHKQTLLPVGNQVLSGMGLSMCQWNNFFQTCIFDSWHIHSLWFLLWCWSLLWCQVPKSPEKVRFGPIFCVWGSVGHGELSYNYTWVPVSCVTLSNSIPFFGVTFSLPQTKWIKCLNQEITYDKKPLERLNESQKPGGQRI